MFGNATKEDLVLVLCEMGETVDSDLGIMELKQKLMLSKAYLEDKEFICDVLAAMIKDRMEKEEYRKREEKVEECHLKERKQELELVRIEARRKKEKETRITEAMQKKEKEARFRAEEETRHKV
ncbi:hypothetical protein TNCV_20191 [Trichonephila clavipes]|nr:hypothetical protein TNCV_20191 [Trichonephila clavipes]